MLYFNHPAPLLLSGLTDDELVERAAWLTEAAHTAIDAYDITTAAWAWKQLGQVEHEQQNRAQADYLLAIHDSMKREEGR